MTYTFYNSTTEQGLVGLMEVINYNTGGLLVALFMLAIFIILLVIQLESGFARSLTISSFVTTILCSIMAVAGLLSGVYVGVGVIITGLGALAMVLQG